MPLRDWCHDVLLRIGTKPGLRRLGNIDWIDALYWQLEQRLRGEPNSEDFEWIEHAGSEICIDPTDYVGSRLATLGTFEPEQVSMIEEHVSTSDTVIELGANIGALTLVLRKQIGTEGTIYAFEPDPGNIELLSSTIDRNSFRNIELIEAVATDFDGSAELSFDADNSGRSTIRDRESQSAGTTQVPAMRLDTFLDERGINTVDFMKIDVEGAEAGVIAGLGDRLADVQAMTVELHDVLTESEREELYRSLAEHGNCYTTNGSTEVNAAGFQDADAVVWLRD